MRTRNEKFDVDGEMLTINDMVARTGMDYKLIHSRIKKGYPLSIILDEAKCIEYGRERYRNKRDKNFVECIGERSGLLTAKEFTDDGQKKIVAECECGELVSFKSPSAFRIAKSCKNLTCTTKAIITTKEDNGTRYRTRVEVQEKICARCELVKPPSHFKKRVESVDGLHSHCRDCMSQYPTSAIDYRRKYRSDNREHLNVVRMESKKKRYASDPKYRIQDALAQRVRSAVTKGYKSASTMKLVGCDILFLKGYLEAQFEQNMSWDNYGEWHIDHILPCASFDLTLPEEQQKCFHYTNLQPLWATTEIARKYGSDKIGNVEKNDRILNR